MALLVLYFSPSNLLRPDESFAAISNRLMVAPVVESLVYSRLPRTVSRETQGLFPYNLDAMDLDTVAYRSRMSRCMSASYTGVLVLG